MNLVDAELGKEYIIQQIETDALLDKVFNGSLGNFLTEYLKNQQLKPAELVELEKILVEQKRR